MGLSDSMNQIWGYSLFRRIMLSKKLFFSLKSYEYKYKN